MLKILHTGDLHLDAPFSALDERKAQIRKNEMRAAFTSMMTYARMNGIQVILVAGDVFDRQFVTRETVQLLVKEFEKFEGPVVIAPGNHDYADGDSVWRKTNWPDNVYLFLEPELESITFDGLNLQVWGYGFTEQNMTACPIAGERVEDGTKINLLVCHCDMVTGKGTDAPVTAADLQAFGADYTAMGHIHNPPPSGERWAYCGCLEPRGFGETGPKGACVIELDKHGTSSTVRMKRVRFSKRRYENASIDLTGCGSMEDVKERVGAYIAEKKYGEDILLQVRFTGMTAEGLVVNPDLLGDFGLFSLQTEDRTIPCPDLSALASDTGIRGAFYRALASDLESGDEEKRDIAMRALRYGLAAIAGENIVG